MIEMTRTRLTAADYFARPETNQIEELINGELIVAPPLLQIIKYRTAICTISFAALFQMAGFLVRQLVYSLMTRTSQNRMCFGFLSKSWRTSSRNMLSVHQI